jgi:hypothetical protein
MRYFHEHETRASTLIRSTRHIGGRERAVIATTEGPAHLTASMDKGFHSPANQQALAALVPFPVLPKTGKCSAADAAREGDPTFIRLRRRHSAVGSGINALEVHGLDL